MKLKATHHVAIITQNFAAMEKFYTGTLGFKVNLHVGRASEIDYRILYSEWLSNSLMDHSELVDFAEFRRITQHILVGLPPNNNHKLQQD